MAGFGCCLSCSSCGRALSEGHGADIGCSALQFPAVRGSLQVLLCTAPAPCASGTAGQRADCPVPPAPGCRLNAGIGDTGQHRTSALVTLSGWISLSFPSPFPRHETGLVRRLGSRVRHRPTDPRGRSPLPTPRAPGSQPLFSHGGCPGTSQQPFSASLYSS